MTIEQSIVIPEGVTFTQAGLPPLTPREVASLPRGARKAYRRRLRVFARDGFRCVRCGEQRRLTRDHKRPLLKGGTGKLSNLQTLCSPCNSAKGADVPEPS